MIAETNDERGNGHGKDQRGRARESSLGLLRVSTCVSYPMAMEML